MVQMLARILLALIALVLALRHGASAQPTAEKGNAHLERRFASTVQPFLERYCITCHGPKKPKADLDLSRVASVAAVVKNIGKWEQVLERLHAEEMPPETAKAQPTASERAAVIAWIRELRDHEAQRTAGDPGTVLARRLSNAE